ncbi:helix-turn-helix domain-containing protein [Hymenobacter volaticus]|nr:AraC family transcriptional regulator [Hymenobacter volaticus]
MGPDPYTVGPGQLLLVRAGQVYSFQPGQQYTGYFCHFHDELLIGPLGSADSLTAFPFLRVWGAPLFVLPAQTTGFVEALLHRLLVEFQAHGQQRPDLLRAYLLALLHELLHIFPVDALPAPSPALALTNRFKRLVATNFSSLPQVRDYADQLHVTPKHLTKTVRMVTGKTPTRWIEETLVLEAKVLLSQSSWPVSEVAAAVGLADASYFSRLFKKHTGMSPLAYRQRVGKS